MKLTKKAAALLLAAALAVSVCATPVFAEDGDATTPTTPVIGSQKRDNTNDLGGSGVVTGTTNVRYKVTESYAWSIPATIDFGENAGANNTSTVNATLKENGPGKKADNNGTGKWEGTAPKVVVSKNVIGVGKTLKIAIDMGENYADTFDKTKNKFYVETPKMTKTGASQTEFEKLYFTITKPAVGEGGTATTLDKTDNKVISVPSGTNTGEQALEFKLDTTTETAEKAGEYVGYVYFYSEIV